jgi:hypothetical protein
MEGCTAVRLRLARGAQSLFNSSRIRESLCKGGRGGEGGDRWGPLEERQREHGLGARINNAEEPSRISI